MPNQVKKITSLFAILCIILVAHTTSARTYFGGGTGKAEFDYSDIDDGDSEKYYIGFQPAGKLYSFEIAVLDSGEADIDNNPFGFESIRVDGYNISAVYNTAPNFGFKQPTNLFFKLGYYLVETEVKTTTTSFTEDSNGLSFGLGLDYAINDAFSLRADLEGLYKVDDFADEEIVTFFTLGAQINF